MTAPAKPGMQALPLAPPMGQRPYDISTARKLPPPGQHFRASEAVHFDLKGLGRRVCGDCPPQAARGSVSISVGRGPDEFCMSRDGKAVRHACDVVRDQPGVVSVATTRLHPFGQQR